MRDLPGLWYKPCVRSMTGYGRGKSEIDGSAVTVEVRSVNHRFLDLKLRGAALDPKHEEALRKCVGDTVTRGAVSLSIRLDRQASASGMQVDSEAAKRAHQQLSQLATSVGIAPEIPLALLCNQPGVMVPAKLEESDADTAALGACIVKAAASALVELSTMRDAEGAALLLDIEKRLVTLQTLTTTLAELSRDNPANAQSRLETRIAKLLANRKVEVDATRMAQEVALLADRLDVTEELVRLESHFEQLALLVRETEPVGRRLDFLVQELGREFNTVTSKSQSAQVARLVVDAKAELEKIREQVQNVE